MYNAFDTYRAKRDKRQAKRRNARTMRKVWAHVGDGLAMLATIALLAALLLLCVGVYSPARASDVLDVPSCISADSRACFALVIVQNDAATWHEGVSAVQLTFDHCNALQHAVWASDGAQVTTAQGNRVPQVDAYCIAQGR